MLWYSYLINHSRISVYQSDHYRMNDDGWSEIELECLLCLMAGSGQTFDVSYGKLPNPVIVSIVSC